MASERLEEARYTLNDASEALCCFLGMLDQMDDDATVDALGVKKLLAPVAGNVSAALDRMM